MSNVKKPLFLLSILLYSTAASHAADPAGRWCQAYGAAARPLHSALDEALDSVAQGWGPDSRNLGYPLHEALLPLAALLPAPDPALDRRLRQALLALESGAEACRKSMPMTTRLRLVEGARALAEFETGLAKRTGGAPACLPAASGREKLALVVGVEGEGMALADTPAGLVVPKSPVAGNDLPLTETQPKGSAGRSRKAPKTPKKPAPARPRK